MNAPDPSAVVRESYDRLGPRFGDARSPTKGLELVQRSVQGLPPGSHVLDVGCGPGQPITRWLLDQGFAVTGVDLSAAQLRVAAQHVPEATLHCGDICEFELEDNAVDAIVSWDSVFHIPRAKHAALFQCFARWLRPGGTVLLTGGGSAGEFMDTMLGERFFYSGYAPEVVGELLVRAGFQELDRLVDDPSDRGHVTFFAKLAAQ